MTLTLRVAATARPGSPEHLYDVEAPPGTTLAMLRDALPRDALAGQVCVDGQRVSETHRLGVPPLVDGAHLEPERDASQVGAALRAVVVSGPGQGRSCALNAGHHDFGRAHPLLRDDPLVSRRHAAVTIRRGDVSVHDLASANGTHLERQELRPGEPRSWRVGEHLRIGTSVIRLDLSPEPLPLRAGRDGRLPALAAHPTEDIAGQTFVWPQADPNPPRTPLRWAAALVPIPVAALLAYFLRSPMMLAFMAMGPLALGVSHLDERRRGRRTSRSQRVEVAQARRVCTASIREALDAERRVLAARLPPPDVLSAISAGLTRPPTVLDADGRWLLRLGHGEATSAHRLQRQDEQRTLTLPDAPVGLAVPHGAVVHLDCGLDDIDATLEWVTGQIAAVGGPTTARPVVVAPSAFTPGPPCARWRWATDHPRIDVRATAPGPALAREDTRATTARHDADSLTIIDARAPGAAELAQRWRPSWGAALVWVGPGLPPSSVHGHDAPPRVRAHLARGHRASHLAGHPFTADGPQTSWFPTVTRTSRRWQPAQRTGRGAAIPARVEAHDVLPNDVATAWRGGPVSSVPIGRDGDGVVALDLVTNGPHALVAGTTGSGKSEFLLAYLRGLFTLNAPQDVTALLIDYKGGATFAPIAAAPHVVGVITDLDAGLAERALAGLRAEITRRERLLARLGHGSYTAWVHAGRPEERLPRFFVIVDEFRVLAEELPDFVSGLVRLAAVGRSLGMHLVLATQRPGGAVTADMRANLDVRVALRVRERSDSIDVIDSPLAAEISPSTPGRAFVSRSGEVPHEVQTAFTGSARALDAGAALHVHPRSQHPADPTNISGQPFACPGCAPGAKTTTNDLQLFVREACAAASRLPRPHRPVLAPLPEDVDDLTCTSPSTVPLDALGDADPQCVEEQPGAEAPPRIGVADLPRRQSQPALALPRAGHVGVCGAPRSGRTQAALTMARAHRDAGRQVWWVGDAPGDEHVSWAVDARSAHAAADLLTRLAGDERDIAVVIDGWEGLHASATRINHGLGAEDLLTRVAEGHRLGRAFVITGGRAVLGSRITPLLEHRIVLRQNDVSEYSLAGLRPAQVPAAMPAGRGLVLPHAHVVHLARASCATLEP